MNFYKEQAVDWAQHSSNHAGFWYQAGNEIKSDVKGLEKFLLVLFWPEWFFYSQTISPQ